MQPRLRLLLLLLAAGALPSVAQSQPPNARQPTPSQHYALAAPASKYVLEAQGVDRAKALAADIGAPKSAPLRYALSREIHNVAFSKNTALGGEWQDLPDGMALWRLPVHATGALTLDFGFRRLFLPPGAQLFIGNANRQLGAYSDADNQRSGQFWTPLLYGDDALIEVLLPQSMKAYLEIDLSTVHVGYRDIFRPANSAKSFFNPGTGSGSCNVDTICPDGDAWRNQINAEAVVVSNGGLCSGQLLNDARNDHVPYMSTANHCIATQNEANSVIVYWKYESPICRAVGSFDSGLPVPTNGAIEQIGGAQLVATYQQADFTLLQLNTPPPAAAHVYWNGWDRSENTFDSGVVLHHPQSDAKRISFTSGTVTLDDQNHGEEAPGLHHWRVDHYSLGTTEQGSSGSGLMDASHRVRGVLSGGAALCTDPAGDDFYGRLSTAWEGDGTKPGRLRDWLDPDATDVQTHDGTGSCTLPNVTLNISANPATAGAGITLSASTSGGTPPFTYAFDVNGDGVADNLDAQAASLTAEYPGAFTGNVSVTVSDHAGCTGTASRALVVQAQSVVSVPNIFGGPTSTELCGNSNGVIDPGERWQVSVTLRNTGTVATDGGYAVFAPDTTPSGHAPITMETPVLALPTLAPGASTTMNVNYSVGANAACGAALKIDYLGTADSNGFTGNRSVVLNQLVNPDASCQPAACTAQVTPIIPKRGNFFDPHRAGSGMTQLTALVPGIDPVFFGAWFTGDSARYPTWYIVNDALHANQVNTTLFQTRLSPPNQFPEIGIAVGNAQVSVVSPTKFVYTWVLNGVAGGAIYVPVLADPDSSLRSWFNTGESGWGTFDELFPSVGSEFHPFMFNLVFLYDAAGMPRWTTGSDETYVEGNVLTQMVARPSCPACVWLDYTIGAQVAGPLSYQFTGDRESISTNLTFPSAYPGTWVRNNLPLTPLVSP